MLYVTFNVSQHLGFHSANGLRCSQRGRRGKVWGHTANVQSHTNHSNSPWSWKRCTSGSGFPATAITLSRLWSARPVQEKSPMFRIVQCLWFTDSLIVFCMNFPHCSEMVIFQAPNDAFCHYFELFIISNVFHYWWFSLNII